MDTEAFPITEFFLFLEPISILLFASPSPSPSPFWFRFVVEREREKERKRVCVSVKEEKRRWHMYNNDNNNFLHSNIYLITPPPIVLLFSVRDQNCSFLDRICFKRERESMFHEKGTAEIGKGGEGGRRKEEGGRGRGRGKHLSLSLSVSRRSVLWSF